MNVYGINTILVIGLCMVPGIIYFIWFQLIHRKKAREKALLKMNPHIKKQWVNALRSGEYIQGLNALRRGDTYCCLGVLCDIYSKNTGNTQWVTSKVIDQNRFIFDKHGSSLPDSVIKWSGLNIGRDADILFQLANKNDTGTSFKKIADIIQKTL